MRDLSTVIALLLEHIPIDQNELRQKLQEYTNCENTYENWNDIGDILYQHIFSDFYPEISWQSTIEKIWTGDEEPDNLTHTNF